MRRCVPCINRSFTIMVQESDEEEDESEEESEQEKEHKPPQKVCLITLSSRNHNVFFQPALVAKPKVKSAQKSSKPPVSVVWCVVYVRVRNDGLQGLSKTPQPPKGSKSSGKTTFSAPNTVCGIKQMVTKIYTYIRYYSLSNPSLLKRDQR